MKEEIVSGLKLAIEHGSSMEQAVQSFINAGYNPQEVNSARDLLTTGISDVLYPSEKDRIPMQHSDPETKSEMSSPSSPAEILQKKEKRRKKAIRIIAIILILLALGGGALIFYLYKDRVFF